MPQSTCGHAALSLEVGFAKIIVDPQQSRLWIASQFEILGVLRYASRRSVGPDKQTAIKTLPDEAEGSSARFLLPLHFGNSRSGFRHPIVNGRGGISEPATHASGRSFSHGARGGLAARASFRALLNRLDAERRRRRDDGAGRHLR